MTERIEFLLSEILAELRKQHEWNLERERYLRVRDASIDATMKEQMENQRLGLGMMTGTRPKNPKNS